MKNNCCLFERLFKTNRNSVFLFGISFFRFTDFDIFCTSVFLFGISFFHFTGFDIFCTMQVLIFLKNLENKQQLFFIL